MQQNSTRFRAAPATLLFWALLPLLGCGGDTCQPIQGRWSNKEGQAFEFKENGKALWFVHFGSQVDTLTMQYRYNCKKQPPELDLSGFTSGPLTGKTLFGILEWNSDTTFRFDAEAGYGPESRPATFDSDQTQKFFMEK